MKNCIMCGKKLKGRHVKYCSLKCAQKGYYTGKAKCMTNTEKQVRELFVDFQRAFDFYEKRFRQSIAWKARVFVCACFDLGHTSSSIGRGIHKDHATVLLHHRKAKEEEKKLAQDFLKNPKTYKYVDKSKQIYPDGFHY